MSQRSTNPSAPTSAPAPAPRRRRAFSLLEMLVVVIIMGLLVALVAPRILGNVGQARVKTTRAQIELLSGAVSQFYLDVGRYPTAEEGLEVLLQAPSGDAAAKWSGPYLEKDDIPRDGWGNDFEYLPPGEQDNNRFIIRSYGADGRPGGENENADLDNRSGA